MADMTARLGKLELPNPILTASGCAGYGRELHQFFPVSELGAVVTRLLLNPDLRETIGRAGRAAFEREQGGVLRTLGIIGRVLDGGEADPRPAAKPSAVSG